MGETFGVLAAVLSSALGGTSIGATRYLVSSIDPLAIGSFRFGIGFLLLLPLTLLRGDRWPMRGDWIVPTGLGILFFALFPILFNASLIFTTAARGALALSTLPLLTLMIGAALGSEALTWRKSTGVVIATFGVAVALLTDLSSAPSGGGGASPSRTSTPEPKISSNRRSARRASSVSEIAPCRPEKK